MREVAEEYGKALRLGQLVEEHERVMATRYRLGRTLQKLLSSRKALDFYHSALEEARSRHDHLAQALLFDRIARSFSRNKAEEWYGNRSPFPAGEISAGRSGRVQQPGARPYPERQFP